MVMTTDQLNDKRSNIRKALFTWWADFIKQEATLTTLHFENWEITYESNCLQIRHKESLMAEVDDGRVFLHVSIVDPYQLPLHLIKETVLIPE